MTGGYLRARLWCWSVNLVVRQKSATRVEIIGLPAIRHSWQGPESVVEPFMARPIYTGRTLKKSPCHLKISAPRYIER